MKSFGVSILIWLLIFIILDELNRQTLIYMDSSYPFNEESSYPARLWLQFLPASIFSFIAGITLKLIYQSTIKSVLIGLSVISGSLVFNLLVGTNLVNYMTSHSIFIDYIFMYAPVISPFLFMPIGVVFVAFIQKRYKNGLVK